MLIVLYFRSNEILKIGNSKSNLGLGHFQVLLTFKVNFFIDIHLKYLPNYHSEKIFLTFARRFVEKFIISLYCNDLKTIQHKLGYMV